MASTKYLKLGMLGAFALLLFAWVVITFTTPSMRSSATELPDPSPEMGLQIDDKFVGSETCKACHEDQFKAVEQTKHGKLGYRNIIFVKIVPM